MAKSENLRHTTTMYINTHISVLAAKYNIIPSLMDATPTAVLALRLRYLVAANIELYCY